jgi:hypothetical protein
VKKKPDPARVTRAQNEVNDRKAGLHIAKWTLHFTRVGTILSALALVPAAVGIYLTVHYATQSNTKPDPGTLVVIKPDIGVGGEQILATPVVSAGATPVDYLRGGTQLRIDCVKEVDNKYGFAHISGSYEQNDWIDATSLVMLNGDSVVPTLDRLGACNG